MMLTRFPTLTNFSGVAQSIIISVNTPYLGQSIQCTSQVSSLHISDATEN